MVQALSRGDQLFLVHGVDQATAHLVTDMQQNFTFIVMVKHVPQEGALGLWQRFQQVGNFRRMERIQ